MTLSESAKHTSLWLDTTPDTDHPTLDTGFSVDVAVVGGGIAGLTTAYMLAERGCSVAVLESERIVSGVTGYTTAKLTSNHGRIYHELIVKFGIERAQMYADANEFGRQHVLQYCEQRALDPDLRRMAAYTYSQLDEEADSLREEAEAAASLGLPASFVTEADLPFGISGAARFEDQHVFHPRKYLLQVAEDFVQMGGRVFENSRVDRMDDGPRGCTLTSNGATLVAQQVVVATNYPIYDPKLFFARLGHILAYVVAVRLQGALPDGMFYSTDESGHSLRPHRLDDGTDLLLVGGEEHPVGKGGDTRERYQKLENWARANFDVESVEYYWCTHDAEPYDHVPMVGRATSSTERVYVATGFRGWGMTNSTAAARIITDDITGQPNDWAAIFSPNRLKSFFSIEMLKTNVEVVSDLVTGKLADRPETVEGLNPGSGGVFEIDGEKVAAYRDEFGALHKLSAACPHMGCIVNWNDAEQTWDCPCHGSRFSKEGRVFHAPAMSDLKPL